MKQKLIETIDIDDLLTTGGIFSKISAIQGQPFEWLPNIALQLDNAYYLEHSGDKKVSPYVERLLKLKDDGKIVDVLSIIAKNIINKYEDKWTRIHSAYIESDYEPLENYSMEQTETPNITKNRTENRSTKVEQTTDVIESNVGIYGFNSTNAVPTSKADGQTKVTTEGDSDKNFVNDVETETGTRGLTRHGNIGVTTSQQMLQSEIDLRKFNFTEMLFMDIDDVMCLSIY